MKKTTKGLLTATLILLASNSLSGATVTKTTAKNPPKNTAKFAKGSIVDGTSNTGSVRRWYFFNEGSIGVSYNWIGGSQYVSEDLGYTAYIRSIESLFGGMSLMIGTEIVAPIFNRPMDGSRSNVLTDHRYLETSSFDGVVGSGVQVPLNIGLEYNGFYVMGFAGYTWLWMNDTYPSAAVGAYPSVKSMYNGVIYGAGIGYKVSNVVNIGIRYTGGSLTNRIEQLKPDAALENDTISHATGRSVYGIPYNRVSFFISLIY